MGDHDSPAGTECILGSPRRMSMNVARSRERHLLDSLSDGTNLVDLEQKGIAALELDSLLDEFRVSDSQIITVRLLAREEVYQDFDAYPTIWKSEVLKK